MNFITRIIICLIISVFAFGAVLTPVSQVNATTQTREQMLVQIQQLLAIIMQLQQLLLSESVDPGPTVPPLYPVQRPITEPVDREEDVEYEDVSGPGSNTFSCNRSTSIKGDNGKLACYGLWDYGNEFGGDENMCPEYGYSKVTTGCRVQAAVCESGEAIATKVYSIEGRSGSSYSVSPTSATLQTIAKNLKTNVDAVRSQLLNVWEYQCEGEDDSDDPSDDHSLWSIPNSAADILVVGVYEGEYPNGVRHSGGYHPEGEVEVEIASVNSQETILILNAYEPVHWKLTGANLEYVKGVLVTGYHDQRVSGLPAGVELITQTFVEDNSTEYFIVYNGKGAGDDDFPDLVEYVENKTSLTPYLFFGEYSTDEVVVSVKG